MVRVKTTVSTMEVSMRSAQTTEKWSTMWPSYLTPGNILKKMQSAYEKATCITIFIVAQSTIVKT